MDSAPPRVTEPGPLVRGVGYAVAATGFVAMAAGAQILVFLVVFDTVGRLVPPMQIALGAAAVICGGALAIGRGWPRIPALVASLALLATGVPWVVWLALNRAFMSLAVFTPLCAIVSLLGVLVSWREVGRLASARAEVERENARLLASAERGADPLWDAPPSRHGWVLPVIGGLLGLPVAAFLTAVVAPEAFGSIVTRVEGIAAGKLPFREVWVSAPTSYPYTGSPFAWYLEYESKWVDLPGDSILAVADAVASDVAWRLAAETGTADPIAGERLLWERGREQQLPLWIAASLRARGAFYSPESLLSRSFDPAVHVVPDTVHLDCDQLVYLFLHVGWRLDLAMEAIPSPFHVYLRYSGPDAARSIHVETTQFRHVDVRGDRVNYLGEGIGESFFIDADYHSSGRGGAWASDALRERAGLFLPWTERDIRDAIVANVLVGLEREGVTVPYRAELEAHVEGSREVTLVANLFKRTVDDGNAALAEGRLDDAQALAVRAVALRASHGPLVVYGSPIEEDLLQAVLSARAPGVE